MSEKVIVSLLPLPACRDTRSTKIATTFKHFGYNSVIFESRQSDITWESPVKLISLGGKNKKSTKGYLNSQRPESKHFSMIAERLHFIRFILLYWFFLPLRAIFVLPKADVYYLHEYRLYPLARLAQIIYGSKVIYDAHDYYPAVWDVSALSSFWRKRFIPFLTWMDRKAACHADVVVAVSNGVAKSIANSYGVSPTVIRNCYDSRTEKSKSRDIRFDIGLNALDTLIVSIGNNKGGHVGHLFLYSLEELPKNVHIAFVGDFHQDKCNLASELKIDDRVHFVGFIPSQEIVQYVSSADLAVLPYAAVTDNYRHILPNGFFQSIAAHLPLLYPALPELIETIGDYNVGRIIDLENPTQVSNQILALLDDSEALRGIKSEVKKLAVKQSWQNEEKYLIEIVQQLLK